MRTFFARTGTACLRYNVFVEKVLQLLHNFYRLRLYCASSKTETSQTEILFTYERKDPKTKFFLVM